MSPEVSDLLKRALALSVDERAALANTLLDSIETTAESVQEAWDEEVARRIADLKRHPAAIGNVFGCPPGIRTPITCSRGRCPSR